MGHREWNEWEGKIQLSGIRIFMLGLVDGTMLNGIAGNRQQHWVVAGGGGMTWGSQFGESG